VNQKIYKHLQQLHKEGKKAFAVLLDPDKIGDKAQLLNLIRLGLENRIDYFFVGGSLLTQNNLHQIITWIRENCEIPVLLFPGNTMQIDLRADGILFISLISGRNPDLLIGQHVLAAPILKRSNLEVIPTGYMIIDGGKPTSVSYMSQTQPLPADKPSLAASTAVAGEMLGLKLIYMDAGSGAAQCISPKMINVVKKSIHLPLIIGGGINSAEKAQLALEAGADIIVVGNGIEENPALLVEIAGQVHACNAALKLEN
jgi:putative glycerol-1-phosphate prenyltransferase